jgi:two-component system, cell cycle sensor histidine kinase and response regulator CckA
VTSIRRSHSREIQVDPVAQYGGNLFGPLVQNSYDVIAVLGESGRVQYVTPSVERVLGFRPDEVIGKNGFELTDPEIVNEVGEHLAMVHRDRGAVRTFEIQAKRKDGSQLWLEVTLTNLLDDPLVRGVVANFHDVSERKDAESDLRRSEERFRSLVLNSSDIICVIDEEGLIRYVSPSVERVLGYTPEEFTEHAAFEHVHEDDWQPAIQAMSEVAGEPGGSRTFEMRGRDKQGSVHWFEVTFTNLLADPNVRGVVANQRDITERKKAEARLLVTEEKYRSLVEDVPAVVYLAEFGPDGRWLYVSPHIHSLTGLSAEEWIAAPTPWSDHLHPEDRARVVAEEMHVLEGSEGDSMVLEYRFVRGDGRTVWVRDEARRVATESGTGPLMRGVMIDVTERKAAAEALRENEERFRSIFEAAPVGIGLVDLEGHTVQTNRVVQEMLGYSDEEFSSVTFDSYTHPDDVARNRELFDQMARGERDFFQMEKRFIHKSGSNVWANLTVSLIRDADGRPAYALGMVENITRRKTLEDQLRQAQKMEAIGRLAGGVAHDFNNLLAVIINCASFLAESISGDHEYAQDLKDIREAGERGANLVRQLLAFSRKEIVNPQVEDLNDIVRGMESLLSRTLGEDVELAVKASESPCPTKVDTGQIEQVIVNLAVNARDAMPNGGVITMTTENVVVGEDFARLYPGMTPESYVRLTMSDNGTGMSEEVLKHIFEPFFTTKARGQGTGLGLATAYGAVKQAGGYISAYSEEGKGSIFSVYLPRAVEVGAAVRPKTRDERPKRGSETILLVEDDDSLRRLVRRMLERNGFSVLEAATHESAEKLFLENVEQIAAIVTDVVMPGGSGKELVERLLAIDDRPPVLYMSGYPEDVIAHHGVLDQGVPFIGKPFTEEGLVDRVRMVLDAV